MPKFLQRCHSGVALGAQVVLHLLQHGLQGCTNAQRDAGGQHVNDQQVQQARDHRAVAVVTLRVVGRQVDGAGNGQGRAAGGDGNRGSTVFAGDVGGIHQVARAARVGHDQSAVARAEQGGTHHLHVAVAVGNAGDAQTEKLVLCVLRDDPRVAGSIELDAPPGLPGGCNSTGRALDGACAGGIAVLQECGHRVVHHLDHHVGSLVIGVHAAVNERDAFAHAAGQLELEVGQSVVAHAAAETHHSGFADLCTRCQFTHRQAGKGTGVCQHQVGHALLGRRKRRKGCGDSVEHGGMGHTGLRTESAGGKARALRVVLHSMASVAGNSGHWTPIGHGFPRVLRATASTVSPKTPWGGLWLAV